MPITLYIHFVTEEPVVVEVDELPTAQDTLIIGKHPRRRDNKPVQAISDDVNTVIYATSRITFIEVIPTGEQEDIFKPFRE